MNRRGFLGMLGAALAGAAVDPEKLLWVPGAKTISIPKATRLLVIGDYITIDGVYSIPRHEKSIPTLKLFLVTSNVVDGDFWGEFSPVWPPVIPDGLYKNVAHMPPPGSRINALRRLSELCPQS